MKKISHGVKMDFRTRIYRFRGKYLKQATFMLCYGSSPKRTSLRSKLGLRRTNVLLKSIKADNYA